MVNWTTFPRVVVTGANGFLGRHLAANLEGNGVRVARVSRSSGFELGRDQLPLQDVEHVFHLAALTGVPEAWKDPVEFHRVNAHGTVCVLDQCRRANVSMTYVSAYVYGRPDSLPIAEDAPVRANNPYAFSKFAAEEACRFYAENFGLNIAIVRPFNVYGPGQDTRFLIPHIASQMLDPEVESIELQDIDPRRDYVYVDDVASAIVSVARSARTGTYNVGSGTSYSVAEIAGMIRSITGIDKPIVSAQCRRTNEIDNVRADISAIRNLLGWMPRVSIEQGLRRTIEDLRHP